MSLFGRLRSRFKRGSKASRKEKSSWKTSDVYTGKPEGRDASFDQFGSGGSAMREGRRR